ncbi:MAG: glucose-6-phosphate isomerase [Candidatus Pacebacteria bacterium]|nr:glucose-6-phosphate isomerase [Candidatus Paceibacterota bacterium]
MSKTKNQHWQELKTAGKESQSRRITDLFNSDRERKSKFNARLRGEDGDDLVLDYSRVNLDGPQLAALYQLAEASGFERARNQFRSGQAINSTESRPVLHPALRGTISDDYRVQNQPVMAEVLAVKNAFLTHAESIRNDPTITDVINIGIGGSDLGPAMASLALAQFSGGKKLHYLSNIDPAALQNLLGQINPSTCHFIIASKTFTTIETMTNAATARQWLVQKLGEPAAREKFSAITTALDRAAAIGIPPERCFGFWDWVGGRYSIWSAIGLPLAIAIGRDNFEAMLSGGREVDQNFFTAEWQYNLPLLLGLIGVWHRNFCGYSSRAVIPYAQNLARFPAYLQQLEMESNGKSIGTDGQPLHHASGGVVWGEPGTNAQHAFFQLLHQGTDIIPVEFLLGVETEPRQDGLDSHWQNQQRLLVANCLAQAESLMTGVAAPLGQRYRSYDGNRPSLMVKWRHLTPRTLGRLIALYEHRVFVEGVIWGINSFDQWGVELGKSVAVKLEPLVAAMKDRLSEI